METKKMSLANMQGKLSRSEMKNVMAGDDGGDNGASCPTYGRSCWNWYRAQQGYCTHSFQLGGCGCFSGGSITESSDCSNIA